MKGITPLILGILGTFAFSWVGLIMIPNAQIGHLDPQMDEDGNDPYPAPRSGMAERGRQIYVANGCVYCHSQQVRADYAGSDIERKWGERRSAPRDYIFDRPVLIGNTRLGPDLANIGQRAPSEEPAPDAAAPAAPAPDAGVPATANPAAAAAPGAPAVPAVSATPGAPAAPGVSPAPAVASASPAAAPAAASAPAPGAATPAPGGPAPVAAASTPASPTGAPVAAGTEKAAPAPVIATADVATADKGEPAVYSAAWHHRHLYDPRSIYRDSTMPAFPFLYVKQRIGGQRSADAVYLPDHAAPPEGWEIVPSYDAECLVAYLMSLDQSHPLDEVKGAAPAAPATSAKAAP